LRDDARNETTKRLADSVDWQQGRVKTMSKSADDGVDGQQGRVKTCTVQNIFQSMGNRVELKKHTKKETINLHESRWGTW